MPEKLLALLAYIEAMGGKWVRDSNGHYQVYGENGKHCGGIAANHGKKTKRDEVKDVYVWKIKSNLKKNRLTGA